MESEDDLATEACLQSEEEYIEEDFLNDKEDEISEKSD